jgi:hypothetical protein
MKLLQLLTPLALVAAATASALPRRGGGWEDCLSQSEAESIVSQFMSILSHSDPATANATALALLDDNYTEISDSILSLEGLPVSYNRFIESTGPWLMSLQLGTATFVGKQVYIDGVLNSPPVLGVETLEVLVAGCTKVLWYWDFTQIGSGEYEVKGFNLFSITAAGQINQTNLEFNSIAWGLDTGYTVTFPAGGGAPTRK